MDPPARNGRFSGRFNRKFPGDGGECVVMCCTVTSTKSEKVENFPQGVEIPISVLTFNTPQHTFLPGFINMAASKTQPNRNKTTRSISFDNDVFELMEERRKQLRLDRSNFLVNLLEDALGVLSHPELHDAKIKANEERLKQARAARGKH